MRILIISISYLLILFACQSGSGSLEQEIANLEQVVSENGDPETSAQLLAKYNQFVDVHPDDIENNAKYLYKAAELQVKMNKSVQAIESLEKSLINYKDASSTPSILLMLAQITDSKMRNEEKANAIYRIFADHFPEREENEELKSRVALTPPVKDLLDNYMNNMYNESTGLLDRKIANNYLDAAQIQVMMNPEDEESPQTLHKAAETARAVFNFNKALQIYDWILKAYPDHEKTPQALFLKAFTYDNNLQKIDEARKLYQEFLDKYPDDGFADDTEFLLENLGKSDEEIIKSFESQKQTVQ